MAPDVQPERMRDEALMAAVSQAMVDLHTDVADGTPVTARAYINDDMLSCVLRDLLTPAEWVLIESGREPQVLSLRDSLEKALHAPMRATVEELTGRPVVALLSQSCLVPDLTLETFFLAPGVA